MRMASELDFEIQPIDSLDIVTEHVKEALEAIRTVGADKQLQIKVFIDVELK